MDHRLADGGQTERSCTGPFPIIATTEALVTRCIIYDIDGTIANGDHRLHLIKTAPKQWDAYFDLCAGDAPIAHMIDLVRALDRDFVSVFATGRAERCRRQTESWLIEHRAYTGRYPLRLYMRADGDHRNDDILKIEMLARIRADGLEPVMVFEDRKRVVDAWRAAGIPCAQVAEGDF